MPIIQVIQLNTDTKTSAVFKRGDEPPVVTQTIREEYRAVSDTVWCNAEDIYLEWLEAGFGDLGSEYPTSQNAVLKSLSFKRDGKDRQQGGPYVWHVTAEFSPPDQYDDKQNDVKISVSTETNDETDGRTDWEGNLNVNSAGDFFEDKLPVKNRLLIFRYTINYFDNPNWDLLDVYMKTNSAEWYGLPRGTCLVRNISTERIKSPEKGFYYWQTQIEIAYNPRMVGTIYNPETDGWTYVKADCGFYTNDGRILDDQGAPVEKAKLLDGQGDLNTSGDPVLLPFKLYGEVDFGDETHGLNLPSPFAGNPTG